MLKKIAHERNCPSGKYDNHRAFNFYLRNFPIILRARNALELAMRP